MDASVIIPTHNRAISLRQAVLSALALEYPPHRYEIIVVDNASQDATPQVAARLQWEANGFNLRYAYEERLGLHNARHAGVRAARGDLLLFSDDDATFDRKWLQAYVAAFQGCPKMVAAGGPVRPIWEQPPPQWLLNYMDGSRSFPILSLMEPYDKFRVGTDNVFFGVNMAIRRSLFKKTGFRPELVGGRTIGDGESGLNKEIRRNGLLVGHVPDALVFHHIPANRMTVDYIRKWAWHLGGTQMYERWWNRRRSVVSLSKEAISILKHWRAWLKCYVVRNRRDPKSIDIQFQASLGWSKLNYVWWMLRDRVVQAALDMTDFRPR